MRKNIYQRPDRKRMEIKMAYLLTVLLIRSKHPNIYSGCV